MEEFYYYEAVSGDDFGDDYKEITDYGFISGDSYSGVMAKLEEYYGATICDVRLEYLGDTLLRCGDKEPVQNFKRAIQQSY